MTTPSMYYPQEDGKLVEIPEEHAAVLALYRDRMPLVREVHKAGRPMLYPLIDVDEDPAGAPEPTLLEDVAFVVARTLQKRRHGLNVLPPDFERLAVAAIRAYVEDMGVFGGSIAHGDGPKEVARSITKETARAGRKLTEAVDGAVNETAADLIANWWVKA